MRKPLSVIWSFGLAALAAAGSGCGGDSTAQKPARDQAVTAVCDRLVACGAVGRGLTYESRDDCETRQRDYWQSTWPPADCDGRISSSNLDACLQTIDTAECNNGLDILNVLANKCTKAKVCSGP